ncbi:mms19 nucleotide excision repair [Thoreauomyces humboldtii]|nr:mms19 nucleotide excision repair [Thoreauomyces humboldtii]
MLVAIDSYLRAQPGTVEASSALNEIVEAISSGKATFLGLVEQLGPQLTHSDPFARAKGVGALSSVLVQCPADRIGSSAVNVLVKFYLERLQDQPSVGELLIGIRAMLQSDIVMSSDAETIAKSIFTDLAVQTYQQTVRHIAFEIFDLLMAKQLPAVRRLGPAFVSEYVQMVDGEKDPRNLLLAFRTVRLIIRQLDFAEHAEDLFGIVFCYFPITFRPPPDDVYGITADDLKLALRECIAATPLFAKYAMPLLIEKLASISGSAKRDAMETITACAPVYGADAFLPHVEHLWNYLKEEIFKTADDHNIAAALSAVNAITMTLSSATVSSSSHKSPLETFLELAVKDSMHNFKDPELKYAKLSGKMLVAAASACDPACHQVVNAVLPLVLEQCRLQNLPTRQKHLLEVLFDFLKAGQEVYGLTSLSAMDLDDDFLNPLLAFKDRLFELYIAASAASSEYMPLRRSGIRGLAALLMSRQLLAGVEVNVAIGQLNQAIITDPDAEVRQEALQSLITYATAKPDVVLQATFPTLFRELPDGAASQPPAHVANVLEAILALSTATLHKHGLKGLLARLYSIGALTSYSEHDVQYAEALATAILGIVDGAQSTASDAENMAVADNIMQPVLQKAIAASISQEVLLTDARILRIVARVLGSVTRCLSAAQQRLLLESVVDTFSNGNLTRLALSPGNIPFRPFDANAPETQTRLSILFAAVFFNARPEIPLPVPDAAVYLEMLLARSLETPDQILSESLVKCVASTLNKTKNEAAVSTFLQLGTVTHMLQGTSVGESRSRERCISVASWIARALVIRSHSAGYQLATEILGLLGEGEEGAQSPAAIAIGVIVHEPEDGCLTRRSFANLLYKQRFFGHCVPVLVNGFQQGSSGAKQAYLLALSQLLKNVPKTVLSNALTQIFPLLLCSLALPDADLKLATLDTLQALLGECAVAISGQISSVVAALLSIGTGTVAGQPGNRSGDTMLVRIAALKTLGDLPRKFDYALLYPHKVAVLRQLNAALDDPKRAVRKEASAARNRWFLLLGRA